MTQPTSLTHIEARVLDAVDDEATTRLLVDLVRTPSITGSDAESDVQHQCARWLEEAGLDVDLWSLDLATLADDPHFPGTEAERSEGYGVAGTSNGDGTPALVLQGHVDVVPPGDLAAWSDADPFAARIDGGVLHGRGACDMKAGLAASVAVVRAIHAADVRLVRPLAIHCVISEEDGGLGALATVRRGHLGDAAVIPEPTGGRVVVANAGALTFRLRVPGRAAHGSVRHDGVSALEAFVPVLAALRELEGRRNASVDPLFAGRRTPYAISVGQVTAGDWPSSVPDVLVADGRLGVALDEDPADARQELELAVADVCARDAWLRDHPVEVSWPGGQFASGRLPDGDPLLDDVRSAVAAVTGTAPAPAAAPYGSDLRLYAGIGGMPTLHYGPGDVSDAHAPREKVRLADVHATARALALVALRRCETH